MCPPREPRSWSVQATRGLGGGLTSLFAPWMHACVRRVAPSFLFWYPGSHHRLGCSPLSTPSPSSYVIPVPQNTTTSSASDGRGPLPFVDAEVEWVFIGDCTLILPTLTVRNNHRDQSGVVGKGVCMHHPSRLMVVAAVPATIISLMISICMDFMPAFVFLRLLWSVELHD